MVGVTGAGGSAAACTDAGAAAWPFAGAAAVVFGAFTKSKLEAAWAEADRLRQ